MNSGEGRDGMRGTRRAYLIRYCEASRALSPLELSSRNKAVFLTNKVSSLGEAVHGDCRVCRPPGGGSSRERNMERRVRGRRRSRRESRECGESDEERVDGEHHDEN